MLAVQTLILKGIERERKKGASHAQSFFLSFATSYSLSSAFLLVESSIEEEEEAGRLLGR